MCRAVVVWLSLLASFPAWADPLDPKDVPAPLRSWVPWALHGAEQRTCPRLPTQAEGQACVWPSRLSLEVGVRGGRFRQDVELFARDGVLLPATGSTGPSTSGTGGDRFQWCRRAAGRRWSSARGRTR